MSQSLTIVAISGSIRSGSHNRKLLRIAKEYAQKLGHTVEEIDLKTLVLPLYDGDVEAQGLPEPTKQLKAVIEKADVLLLASPEYNYSISGVLKNAIDWASRGGNSLGGKTAAIFGASPGRFGTVRAQMQLRQVLQALNVFVLSQPQVLVSVDEHTFDESGALTDQKTLEQLQKLIDQTIRFAILLKNNAG